MDGWTWFLAGVGLDNSDLLYCIHSHTRLQIRKAKHKESLGMYGSRGAAWEQSLSSSPETDTQTAGCVKDYQIIISNVCTSQLHASIITALWSLFFLKFHHATQSWLHE